MKLNSIYQSINKLSSQYSKYLTNDAKNVMAHLVETF